MIFYLLVSAVVFALCILVCADGRGFMWNKILTVLLYGVLIILLPIAYFETLSRPKYAHNEIIHKNLEEAVVEGFAYDEGIALYLLLELPDVVEPRYYRFPWTNDTMKKIEQLEEAQKTKRKMKLKHPFAFEKSLETRRRLHPMPHPKGPDKPPRDNDEIVITPNYPDKQYGPDGL
jgi:hypothetical protein